MAQATKVQALDRTIHKTNTWLSGLAEELGTDEEVAYKAIRGYLHAIRDNLNHDEAVEFAAQLPALIRGIYYDGWDPSATPERMKREDFLGSVRDKGALIADDDPSPEDVVAALTRFLRAQISEGELEDVFPQLTGEVRGLVEPAA